MKKLLLTGAYGLVGSAICRLLERDYPEIEITKIKFDDIYDQENDLYFYYEYKEHWDSDKGGFDLIIHAAGYGQPLKFSEDKLKTIDINTRVTKDLLRCLKPDGKFLFVSTSEVYSGAFSPYKETDIGTTTPQHPRACYIEGKRCGEAICMAYKEQGYDVKIARLALAYGPGTKKGDTRVLNQFIEQALTTGKIQMKDQGLAWRTYGYVDDVATQMLSILFNGTDVVYNVGGKSGLAVGMLAHTIGKMLGVPVHQGEESLAGAPDDVKLDMTKTLTEFPMDLVGIEEGLKRTIEYQKELYGKR
jgi:nucleoside-diphosphate-sugar epimerase